MFFTSVSESNLNALSSRIECGLKIGIYSVTDGLKLIAGKRNI